MAEESPKCMVPKFFNSNASSYDRIVSWTTFGKDGLWKRKILEHLSDEKNVLDLACGTGILTRQIAKTLPGAEIVGVDVTQGYLEKAMEKSAPHRNISFVNQDAEKLSLGEKFSCITASYLPKYCTPDTLIRSCLDHLDAGGKIILHDFTYPKAGPVRRMWDFYFRLLNLAGLFTPGWRQVFADLPRLIRASNWVQEYEEAMEDHGLETRRQDLTWGSSAVLVGTKTV